MSRHGNFSGKDAVAAFQKAGWVYLRQVGSHAILTKEGSPANLSIPQHKELSIGTLRSLIIIPKLLIFSLPAMDTKHYSGVVLVRLTRRIRSERSGVVISEPKGPP